MNHKFLSLIKRKWIIIVALICFAMFLLYMILGQSYINSSKSTEDVPIECEQNVVVDTSAKVLVYLTGAVEEPGVYEVDSKSSWGGVVKSAGGFLPYADDKAINLAKIVEEGDHLHIPFDFNGNPEELLRKTKININMATADELTTITGIGPSTAKKIIDYRLKNKSFTSTKDIMKIKGIGVKTYEKIKDEICV